MVDDVAAVADAGTDGWHGSEVDDAADPPIGGANLPALAVEAAIFLQIGLYLK